MCKHKALMFMPVCAFLVTWVGCTQFVEWRGGGIPKLVVRKSGPDVSRLNEQRQSDSASDSVLEHPEVAQIPYWTTFRGPAGDGVYYEQQILTDWPKGGPNVLWRKLIGGGHSSFTIANGLVFTIEQQGANEMISAFNIQDGTVKWTHEYFAKFEEYFGGVGPRSTPVWNNGRLFSMGAKGHLNCLEAKSGKLLWNNNLINENNVEIPNWGVSGSPFVYQNTVVVVPGGNSDNAIVALDVKTGKKVWSTFNGTQVYSTPVLLNILDSEQLVVPLTDKLISINPANGKLYWSHPWKIFVNNSNISQPVRLSNDIILISAGYGTGAEAFRVIPNGDSMRTLTLWKSKSLKTKFSSPIFWKGHLYGMNENQLVCLDAKDGFLKWRGAKYGYGQIIAASDHLIILRDSGDLALVEMNPDRFVEKANFKALKGGRTWNTPALAHGLLFVRNSYEMACFDLRTN